jgi:hypothetical protein
MVLQHAGVCVCVLSILLVLLLCFIFTLLLMLLCFSQHYYPVRRLPRTLLGRGSVLRCMMCGVREITGFMPECVLCQLSLVLFIYIIVILASGVHMGAW